MKRFIFFALPAIVFLFSCNKEYSPINFEFTEENKKIIITGYTGDNKELIIPKKINGRKVSTIANSAFSRKQLTSITIPNSVKTVGVWAFERNKLTGISLPKNTNIQINSFYVSVFDIYNKNKRNKTAFNIIYSEYEDCEIVIINNSIIEIINYTGSEKEIIIPETINNLPVTAIGHFAFYDKQLTCVTIPNTVSIIGDWSFFRNDMTNLIIPDSVTIIGDHAFAYNDLIDLIIGTSVTQIGECAFFENQLQTITIPNSVTTINDGAFFSNQLTNIIIPNSITFIGNNAFFQNQLTTITIPNPSAKIDPFAFDSGVEIIRE